MLAVWCRKRDKARRGAWLPMLWESCCGMRLWRAWPDATIAIDRDGGDGGRNKSARGGRGLIARAATLKPPGNRVL